MPDELDTLVHSFVQVLNDFHVVPRAGVSSELLDKLERDNGWKFPDAVRRYLLCANGCTYGFFRNGPRESWDCLWDFYPVEEWTPDFLIGEKPYVIEIIAERGWSIHGCALFSDAMIEAPFYGVCLAPSSPYWGQVVAFGDTNANPAGGRVLKNHFEDFMRGFIADPENTFGLIEW